MTRKIKRQNKGTEIEKKEYYENFIKKEQRGKQNGRSVIFHIDYKKVPNKILNEKTRKNQKRLVNNGFFSVIL